MYRCTTERLGTCVCDHSPLCVRVSCCQMRLIEAERERRGTAKMRDGTANGEIPFPCICSQRSLTHLLTHLNLVLVQSRAGDGGWPAAPAQASAEQEQKEREDRGSISGSDQDAWCVRAIRFLLPSDSSSSDSIFASTAAV